MGLIQKFDIQNISDHRGDLIVVEQVKHIPFEIKRVYMMTNMSTHPKGFHAHKQLRQAMVCVTGSCRLILDDGQAKEDVIVDTPHQAVLIDKMIWHELHDFSNDCVICVFASDFYDEDDYIRNYEDFEELVRHV